jgi:DNA/RNA endonuclease YhcR with UshA esterase domain
MTRTIQTNLLRINQIALVLGLFLFYPQVSFAFQEVEINEINYTGYTIWSDDTVTDANDEFIELKNPSNTPITLTGWSLRIVSGAGDKIIPLTSNITDYIVIRKIATTQTSLTPLNKVINVTSSNFGSLSNTAGAYIELRNDKGITIDSVNFAGKWPATTKQGESLHKINTLSWEIKPLSPLDIIPVTPPTPPIVYEGIMISEIYPNPAEGKKEFVELANITDKDIDISGWKLDDIPNGGSAIQTLSGIIPAKGFVVLEDNNALTIILNNDFDSVILYDPNNTIQSQVDYSMKDSQKGSSYMFIDNNWIWNTIPSPNAMNIAPISITPTPAPNPIPTPNPIPVIPIKPSLPKYSIGSIILSEIYPYPLEGVEFIELNNTTDKDIDITDWKLSDLAKSYTLSGIIPAKGYRVWNQDESKISLNNTSETITLTDNYNQIQSTTSYTKAKKGLSYIPLLQNWGWTNTLTPNAPNIFTEAMDDTSKNYRFIDTIEDILSIEDGELLELQGQIIIPPNTLNDTSFYIQNNSRIVKVYDRQKRFPSLKEGDIVRIKSEWHNTDTQQYLKTVSSEDIRIIDIQKVTIKAENIKTINTDDWGKLVKVNGVLDTNTKTKLVLSNSKYTAPIKLYSDTIIKPKMKKGDTITITGFTEIYDGEIRVIPWNSSQIRVIPAVKIAKVSDIKKDISIASTIENDDNNTKQLEYQGLDEFQLKGEAQLIDGVSNTKWYKTLAEWAHENIWFSIAIILNIIWWGYIYFKKIKNSV